MESEPSTSHETNSSETVEITRICKRYCCIPQCKSNNRKTPEMSFHKILKNPELRKKWVRLLKRKGIRDPGPRVCSAHLVGGTKIYSNNIPTIFATATTRKPRKSPTTRTMDNKNPVIAEQFTLENTSQDSSVIDDSSTKDDNSKNTIQDLENTISSLQAQNMALSTKYDEDVASDGDFKFYTGFPNYSCFKAFYNYLSPSSIVESWAL